MKKAILLLTFIMAAFLPLLAAASQARHPIDAWLAECMEKDPSTRGMNACLGEAYAQWDRELNRMYKELSAKLNESESAMLRDAQRAWISYRDREFAWLTQFYVGLQGSMYTNMLAADRVELVRRRAMELSSLLDVLAQK